MIKLLCAAAATLSFSIAAAQAAGDKAAASNVNAAERDCGRNCLIEKAERWTAAGLQADAPELLGPAAQTQWTDDGASLLLLERTRAGVFLYSVDVTSKKKQPVVALKEIAAAARKKYSASLDFWSAHLDAMDYDAEARAVRWSTEDFVYLYDIARKRLSRTARQKKTDAQSVSPGGEFAVFTQDHDLYVRKLKGSANGKISRLSSDSEQWRSFAGRMAVSNPVDAQPSQQTAPRVKWIGDGPYFYIERWDNRNVGDMWIIRTGTSDRPTLVTQKFAMPGEDNIPVPELWIFNADDASGYRVDTDGWAHVGNMDINSGGVYPSRDGRSLYFARMSRGYEKVELCKVDIGTGRVDVLLQEPSGRSSGVRSVEFRELSDGFIWKSDRDGFPHYYLYDQKGKLKKRLTEGSYAVDRLISVNETARRAIFSAYGAADRENPYHRYIQTVHLDTAETKRLSNTRADHQVWISPDGRHFVEKTEDIDLPPAFTVKTIDGDVVMKLTSRDATHLSSLGWTPPRHVKVTAADGKTPLFGVIWTPQDFDETKKYPVITYVYPGPQGEHVPFGRFAPAHKNAALAELGFVVVSIGHRGGASNRGRAYQAYGRSSGNMRDYPVTDNKHALEQLIADHPFMDGSRIGVYGHSGGGFMTVSAILNYPSFYKAAVAGAGNHDNNFYEMNSGEFYFGHPRNGPAGGPNGYAINSALAGRLQGALLLVHGDEDEDVHLAHTLRLQRAFIEAGKDVDLVILPGEPHSDFTPAADRYYRLRLWNHFLDHLTDDPRPARQH